MKRWTLVVIALALVLAAGWLVFANRSALRQTVASVTKPALPTAQPYAPSAITKPASVEVPAGGAALGSPERAQPEASTSGVNAATGPAATPTTAPSQTKPTTTTASTAIPQELNLAVPFITQAPRGDWGLPYQEACEEASVIMGAAYFNGETSITPDDADKRILDTVAWEKQTFGFYEDTTAEETARMAREHFGLQATVKPVTTIDDIKAELAQGSVVLLPSAGRLLGNPNFSGAGPLYHMLVVKGYLRDGRIITNDPGTRHGADYLYDPTVLYNAIHDWNGGDVEHGSKVMIVLNK
jgi:hypothetical protein